MTHSERSGVQVDPVPRSRGSHLLWVAVIWARVVLGLALAGAGGAAFGQAWANEQQSLWWAGGMTLMVGILLVLSGLYARSHPPNEVPRAVIPEDPVEAREPLVPLLGAILVYKYHLITHKQLQEALAEQLRAAPRRRLGEMLVLKGLITTQQLEEALDYQHSCSPQVAEV